MTVYLDIVFLENLLMNYIIIYASGVVIKAEVKKLRLFIASSVGAIYTIVMYLDVIPIYSNFIMKIVLSIVIVYISFKPKTVKKLIKEIVIFYLVSFVFGGCIRRHLKYGHLKYHQKSVDIFVTFTYNKIGNRDVLLHHF